LHPIYGRNSPYFWPPNRC